MKTVQLGAALAAAIMFASAAARVECQAIMPDEARTIAEEAYIFAYPMLENYRTMHAQAIDKSSPTWRGPFNVLGHMKALADPKFTEVVTPNTDTLYSFAWADLRSEPLVLKVPEIKDKRYYTFQLIDLYTHNFAYVGTRTTGSGAGHYLIAGPGWAGEVPKEINQAFISEGNFVLIGGRTGVNGEKDLAKANDLQNQYQLVPLHTFLGRPAPKPAPATPFPPWDQRKGASADFIPYVNFLLSQATVHPDDMPALQRFARIGIGPGEESNPERLDPEVRKAVNEGVASALKKIELNVPTLGKQQGGWTLTAGIFGSRKFMQGKTLTRASAAMFGLYGNTLDEAYYPSALADGDGGPLDAGKHDYVLRFTKDQIPQALAFWSVTLYKLPERLLSENASRRYAIGDRTEGLTYGDDGSLTLYIQHQSPGKARESNWLPAPPGPFYLVLRMYLPTPEAMAGPYAPPPVVKTR